MGEDGEMHNGSCAHAGFWPPGLEAETQGSNLDVAA